MFTFEDLLKLDPTAIQTIIRAVDKDKLPTALKGATESLRDLFFSNMSERAAKIMKEDMASMGPVRLKDVEEAQQYIVTVTKDLEGARRDHHRLRYRGRRADLLMTPSAFHLTRHPRAGGDDEKGIPGHG